MFACWCCICRFTARNLNHKMLKYICLERYRAKGSSSATNINNVNTQLKSSLVAELSSQESES